MQYRQLGLTDLRVSILGIGTGGPSLFGQSSGVSESDVTAMVHRGLDLGINFFDTSPQYRDSEARLGRVLASVARDDIVVATKFAPVRDGVVVAPDDVVQSVESSLRLLRVEQLDLLQFHGLLQPHCGEVLDRLWPTVAALRERGRCRWVGVTESYKDDPAHGMLERVLHRPPFDTAMVGYNLMSQTAESVVLPRCIDEQIGVIGMVPVRRALGDPDRLRACLRDAAERGVIAAGELPEADPLGWLVTGEVESVPAAAYKFASAHPAVATVLTGTSRVEHLEQNVRAVTGPPLPDEHMARLRRVFGHVREALAN